MRQRNDSKRRWHSHKNKQKSRTERSGKHQSVWSSNLIYDLYDQTACDISTSGSCKCRWTSCLSALDLVASWTTSWTTSATMVICREWGYHLWCITTWYYLHLFAIFSSARCCRSTCHHDLKLPETSQCPKTIQISMALSRTWMKHRISTISATWNAWNAWNAPVIRHRSKFERGLGVSRHFGSSERASAVSSGCSLESLPGFLHVSWCFVGGFGGLMWIVYFQCSICSICSIILWKMCIEHMITRAHPRSSTSFSFSHLLTQPKLPTDWQTHRISQARYSTHSTCVQFLCISGGPSAGSCYILDEPTVLNGMEIGIKFPNKKHTERYWK
jgi:hypothetical protein